MKRSLKAGLGLSMLVALIASAFGVMSASAVTSGHITSSAAGVTDLHVTEGTSTNHKTELTAFGLTVICHKVTYTASSFTATTQSITVTPKYENCTSGENPAHVRMNGCHYIFTSRSSGGHATTHFVCSPAGNKAEVEITGSKCVMKFGAQTPAAGAIYTNQADGTITTDVTAEGITAEAHGGICVFFPTTTHTAKLTGSVTVSGTSGGVPATIQAT